MSYKYNKELSSLKEATDKDHKGLFGKAWTTLIFLFLFILLSSIGSCLSPDFKEGVEFNELPWATRTEHQATEIKASLESLPFGKSRSGLFHNISSFAIRSLISEANYFTPDQKIGLYYPLSWHYIIARNLVSGIIAISFLLILSIPYWLLAFAAGIAIGYSRFIIKNTPRKSSLLALCDRKVSPFYSGIYGLLVPNSNRSGTETYVPTLVYPKKAPLPQTRQTKLYNCLPIELQENALIQELVQIVIHYSDYPSNVPPEHDVHTPDSTDSLAQDMAAPESPTSKSPACNPVVDPKDNPGLGLRGNVRDHNNDTLEEQTQEKDISDEKLDDSFQGQVVSNAVNIESNCLAMISAALELHQSLAKEFDRTKDISRQAELSAQNFATSFYTKGNLRDAIALSLTPAKLALYRDLKIEWIITAILSINASKCLVFRKKGEQYIQISLYPHLQARALLQSLPSFFSSCDSLERWLIRNSLIYSRRSATLGRALLPKNLPTDVKTLRDIVELSQYSSASLPYYARLLRIENSLELLAEQLKSNLTQHYKSIAPKDGSKMPGNLPVTVPPKDFGFIHAGAFIFPLSKLISLMFRDVTDEQIAFSIKLIIEIQEIGISTPQSSLPGATVFWSLLDSVKTELTESNRHPFSENSESLPREKWFLARLALIRYNWLQFRIDELAPAKDNIVYTDTISGQSSSNLSSADKHQDAARGAMAPLRLKRLKELLGQDYALFFADDTYTNKAQIIYPSWEDYHDSQHR